MKTKIYLRVFAAVTMLAAFSCAKEIEPEVTVVGTTEETNQVRTYSVTVHAEKGEPATKALNLTGNTLQASWEEGEVVDVYKGDDKIGTLTAQSTGMSTTLKGTIHATLAEGDDLILKFCSPNYTTQDGTLEYIAANCDYATAEVTVSTIDDNTGAISISDATFVSHQAIVKFTLKEDDGTTAVKASVLTFQSGETSITVSPIPASSELFVAVPEISAGRINLTATDSDDCRYGYNKSNAELTGGKYYEVGVRMSLIVTTESELNAALVNHKRIMLGADIPLNAYVKIGQNGSQDITLDLNGHKLSRSLTAADANGHVIEVFGSGTLTIKDSSGDDSGQISGGWANNGGAICNYGTLSFQGGTITACKGVNGGGIINNSGCTLQITGGLITNCRSDAGGGAIVNHGTATISGCTFRGNIATTRGGAIWSDGTLTVQDCTFTGNEALANGGDGQNEGDGGAIHVQAGTTTLTDVTITNNTSKDAGAIYVTSGAKLNIGGTSTISGNRSTEHGGGGIVNNGTANLSGSVRITGNNCHTYGGGIWNNGILKMEGDIQVKDNTRGRSQPNNVYLKSSRVINVTGSLAGSGIGLSMENNGTATSGLGSNGDLSCFFCDNAAATEIGLVNGEATLSIRTDVVYYVERGWENSSLTEEYKSRNDCIVLAGTDSGATYNLESGRWYVVKGSNVQYKAVIAPSGDGANLILCDGATLTSLIIINEGCRLNIYAQSEDSGKIVAEVPHVESLDFPAGIGSEGTSRMGDLTIHGGNITARGYNNSAGIGAGGSESYEENSPSCGTVEIYGGTVKAYGGEYAAGIGAGSNARYKGDGGSIWIYDGNVYAEGGFSAAGIGVAEQGHGGFVHIYGGRVEAVGKSYAAGIGGGRYGSLYSVEICGGEVHAQGGRWGAGIGFGCNDGDNPTGLDATITISGGKVEATGGAYGAGIGGGQNGHGANVTIYGGTVNAQGGEDAAGIGSGEQTSWTIDGGSLTVEGGSVTARGGNHGAGIGGGQDASGASVTVKGGTVNAYGGTDAAGIGSGERYDADSLNGGSLNVSGGYVFADGSGYGSGIGGGEDADGARVEIHGGTVVAWCGDGNNAAAIGSNLSGTEHQGSLNIDDGLMVHAGDNPGSTSLSKAGFRVSDCWYHRYARVEPCDSHEYVDGKCKWCGHPE